MAAQRVRRTDSSGVAELPIGKHVDAAAYDPANALVFASSGDRRQRRRVLQLSKDQYKVEGGVTADKGSKTMALDPSTHRISIPSMSAGGLVMLVGAPASN